KHPQTGHATARHTRTDRHTDCLMKRKTKNACEEHPQREDPKDGGGPRRPDPTPGGAGGAAGGALLEPPEEAVARLAAQLAELKDRHLRLAADYENFRRRTQKARTELWAKAPADLLHRLVAAPDHLSRFAHAHPGPPAS